MIKATIEDRENVILFLSLAFRDNQSVNYIVRPGRYKTSGIYALMEYSFDRCLNFGEIYLSDDKHACALLLPPGAKRTNLLSVWLDIKLIFNAIGLSRIGIVIKREAKIKKLQFAGDHYYLWFIGADPSYQHTGAGSRLLTEISDYAHAHSKPVCLETSTLTNIPWYKRHGFEVYEQLDLGYLLYFLKTTF